MSTEPSFGIGLPPTSKGTRPTDRSHAATPHEIRFVRLEHHRDAQTKSSTRFQAEPSGIRALVVSQLIGHHRGECFLTQEPDSIYLTVTQKESCELQIVVEGRP